MAGIATRRCRHARLPRASPRAGDSKGAPPPHVYDVLKPVLVEKEKAENRLKVGKGCLPFFVSILKQER